MVQLTCSIAELTEPDAGDLPHRRGRGQLPSEQRRQERVRKRAVVHYHSNGQGSLGVITDVSYGGLRLACKLPSEDEPACYPGRPEVGAEIRLISILSEQGNHATARCTIQWCRDDLELGVRDVGLKFTDSFQQVDRWMENGVWGNSTGRVFPEYQGLRARIFFPGNHDGNGKLQRIRLAW
ncbi:MAG: PilZ domain-containing protein [Armatimonadetes bacterium]|nr:PilZ domain-containing protein [Armatimonadota bacterium]